MGAQHLLTLVLLLSTSAGVVAAAPTSDAQSAGREGYRVGVNTAYLPNLRQRTIRRWVRESGAAMPRVGMRMDLFQKGMPDHPDHFVIDAAAVPGGSALAMLFNESQDVTYPDGTKNSGCRPPAGLWEPVFDNGTDDATAGASVNPRNEWAVFAAAMAERYDGDGVGDARNSSVVTWFSVWNEPDWLGWPNRPKDPGDKTMRNWFRKNYTDLARLAFVSHRAIRFAHPKAKVGMQICFHESLGFLLDDPKHPLAKNCDFIDFHAYGGKGSDDNCFRNDGIVPVAKSMLAEYKKRKLPAPALMCTETGVGGGPAGSALGRTQAAAAIKANVVGASLGLVTTCWYALVDPSWENMGLVADASKLPPDGAGAEVRDAMTAMRTASVLLNGAVSGEAVFVGEGAHAYRIKDRSGRDFFVAWADDAKGPDAKVRVKLTLPPGQWEQLAWDYAKTQAPVGGLTVAQREQAMLELTAMPIFLRQVSAER